MDINERILLSANNEYELESLLKEFKPFIASCASRFKGKHIDEHDDEMSIAILAFVEAIKRFRPESGKFLNFASHVIKCRLIDDAKGKGKNIPTVSLDEKNGDEDYSGGETGIRGICLQYSFDDPVKTEIEILSGDLKTYGFSFMDICKCSPKHEQTKKACAKAVRCILEHDELLKQLRKSKLLPVKNLELITSVHRKTIERHRNYIVCLVEILSGEYVYLSEYVKFVKEAK